MSVARMSIPFSEQEAELLRQEARRQGRTFSGYIQAVLSNHIDDVQKEKKIETSRERRRERTIKIRRTN